MKTFVVSAVSIVLASILFCPMVMAAPSMPSDLQMVQPDPSLPKELSAFFGKWEGSADYYDWFLIVEKIDEKKASLYLWRKSTAPEPRSDIPSGWIRREALVTKQGGKYKLVFGSSSLMTKGEYLDVSNPYSNPRLKRVQ
jgi:hypothetical protein